MKRTALALLLALCVVPQASAAGWLKTVSAAQKQAKEKKQLIFVDLFAEWCGWCHRFEKEVYPTEAFQKSTDDMVLLRLDTEDRAEGTKFAQRYQATSLPTFLVLNSDLSIAGVIKGYAPASQFSKMIDETVGKYRTFEKMVAQEKTFTGDYAKRFELAREFRVRLAYGQSESRLRKLIAEKGVPAAFRDQAYYELGIQYLLQGRHAEVTKLINEFGKVQTQGDYYERARLLASDVCMAQGDLKCAAAEMRKFKQTFPRSALNQNIDVMLPQIERQISVQQR